MLRVLSVLVLACVGLLHAVPLSPTPLMETQENFDLQRFLGKWHDIAKASSCPAWQRHKGDSAIGTLELNTNDDPKKISMTRTMFRSGTCKQISGDYELTETPGRFHYHSVRWGADVDAYVVHTNYDEYAIVVMKKKRQDETTTSVKLYGRSMELRPTLLDEFKALVKEQGMSEDTIALKQNKGECVPGQHAAPESTPEPQRMRRNLILPAPEETGSGYEDPIFNVESCKAAMDTGPCFGLMERYYYNSTLMACMSFTYGGCMGNQNNFMSEKVCLQSCRTEAACRLPIDAGSCDMGHQLWAFDSAAGKCVSFKYGGCKGNSNKFYSQSECEEYCGMKKKEDDEEFLKVN